MIIYIAILLLILFIWMKRDTKEGYQRFSPMSFSPLDHSAFINYENGYYPYQLHFDPESAPCCRIRPKKDPTP